MDYEKAYKEAYAKAKELLENAHAFCEYDMEVVPELAVEKAMCKIFPELGESEDEKIRKMLIEYFKSLHKTASHTWNIPNDRIIAWLEKQKDGYTKKDIDDTYLRGIADAKSELEKQKQKWSEEDENRFQNIIACIEDCYNEKDAQDLIRWFKSLRHQPKQVWSNADIKLLELIIDGYQNTEDFSKVDGVFVDWLKSLKCRMKGKED